MSDSTQENLDQTTFSESAPLMNGTGTAQTPTKPSEPEPKLESKRPIKKPIPLPLLAGGILIVIIVVASAITMLSPKEPTDGGNGEIKATATPTTSNIPPELEKAISSLDADVKAADPQANDLPFPPVNFQLHLRTPGSNQ
jgi:hypothetical protein